MVLNASISQSQPESVLTALLEAAVDAIVIIDSNGIIQSVSDSALTLFGYAREEMEGENVCLLMPMPHRAQHNSYIKHHLLTGEKKVLGKGREVEGMRKDGTAFPMRLSLGRSDADGSPMFVGICHDLSDFQQLQQRTEVAEFRYQNIVEDERELVCRIDKNLSLTFVSTALLQMLECSIDEVIGYKCNTLFNDEDISVLLGSFARGRNISSLQQKYTSHLTCKGESHYIEWGFSLSPAADEIQAVGIDVTEREQALLTAQFLKHHDPLTKMLNRKSLIKEFYTRYPANTLCALIYLDFNHLQIVSHMFDHDTADKLIIEAARRLIRYLPSDALVGRTDASAFIVVMPAHSLDHARNEALHIVEQLEMPYELEGEVLRSDVSAGISFYPNDSKDISVLISQAESAIIHGHHNHAKVVLFETSQHESFKSRVRMEQQLRFALANDELHVYLQPKVDLMTKCIVGYESLLRWPISNGGFIPPGEFIPVAEQTGLGCELDRYVLRKVVELIAECRKTGRVYCPIAVNITAQHFGETNLVEYVSELLDFNDVDASDIELEITESVILGITPDVATTLEKLRCLGLKISIDDFGTGYSSLSYLKDLSVDALKIDKSFIDEISDSCGMHIIKAILSIAGALNLEVIAEGIETSTQYQLLLENGCRIGQGYYFSKPEPYLAALSKLDVWIVGKHLIKNLYLLSGDLN
ncbi:EAL domain-containing protein [Pontibacterium granulatum]|uniref:sensor domain-containing protein n=1 Tax=Pontibacterium granulatum TaxID=2036029 RepID=UPI00249CB417|nr:EAL domain-containing protein [Pontibacterium granulatum]MDI3326539.1 EAL domain-containing protein [Pontibacterium granulatum]